MSRFLPIVYRGLALVLGTALGLVLLESTLRLLPVSEGLFLLPVDAGNPVPRFVPDRTLQWSKGWNFSLRNTIRINNYGFVNAHDYEVDDDTPLLAVIGDSYVEAAMVPFADTAAGRLRTALEGSMRVYSFGVSGSPLSQYLAYATYVRQTFGPPSALIVVVVGNDFADSLLRPASAPGYHYLTDRDGRFTLRRLDRGPSPLRGLAKASALARYLTLNVQVQRLTARRGADRPPDPQREGRINSMITFFLDALPAHAGLDAARILLVVDGLRHQIYGTAGARSQLQTFAHRRETLIDAARARSYPVLDLQPIFAQHFAQHGQHFEYPNDGHWNSLAHGLVAQGILERPWLTQPAAPSPSSPSTRPIDAK